MVTRSGTTEDLRRRNSSKHALVRCHSYLLRFGWPAESPLDPNLHNSFPFFLAWKQRTGAKQCSAKGRNLMASSENHRIEISSFARKTAEVNRKRRFSWHFTVLLRNSIRKAHSADSRRICRQFVAWSIRSLDPNLDCKAIGFPATTRG